MSRQSSSSTTTTKPLIRTSSVGGANNTASSAISAAVAADQAAAAAASLQLLLREDPLLVEHGMNESHQQQQQQTRSEDVAAIPYAAALLQQQQQQQADSTMTTTTTTSVAESSSNSSTAKERADWALQDVERKLALVESLAVKLSRTSPEAVAGHLLRLHGYQVIDPNNDNNNNNKKNESNEKVGDKESESLATTSADNDSFGEGGAGGAATTTTTTTTTTLSAIRERADRLERQSNVLETVATRVESSLQRGLDRMDIACLKLQRVLDLSTTLKMILRAQFENSKLQNYDLDDLRDLTKAAASVSILEDLFRQPQLLSNHKNTNTSSSSSSSSIALVDQLLPEATQKAVAVRQATQVLLEKYYREPMAVQQLGATLQVYFHLGELPHAVWKVVDFAHDKAEAACKQLWNPTTLSNLADQAAATPRKGGSSSDARSVAKRLVQLRLEAAEMVWAQGIAQATTSVRNLQRVLISKTDPESRKVFMDVVAQAPIPFSYQVDTSTTSSQQQQQDIDDNNDDDMDNNNNGYPTLQIQQQEHQQQHSSSALSSPRDFSLFSLFWKRFCRTLAGIVEEVLQQADDKHKLGRDDVAALYPPVRRVAKNLVGQLQESLPLVLGGGGSGSGGVSSLSYEDAVMGGVTTTLAASGGGGGILGGSKALNSALVVPWKTTTATSSSTSTSTISGRSSWSLLENPQEATHYSADSWTQARSSSSDPVASMGLGGGGTTSSSGSGGGGTASAALTSAIFQSKEWKTLTSNSEEASGLYPLQRAFVQACTERLCQPLQYMFPENVALNDDGVPIASSGLTLLPSKFDVQRFDENIRLELSLADPKEGGGEFTAVTMIAECVVNMIAQFCNRARNALSGASDKEYLVKSSTNTTTTKNDTTDWSMTESLQHDRKVAIIMYTLHTYLESGPEKAFIAPYRPATSPQHEEAAALCLSALQPALRNIDHMVKSFILDPLCRASNRRLADIIAKIHLGVYMEGKRGGGGGSSNNNKEEEEQEELSTSFVQNELAPVYEAISNQILSKFPPPYASVLASNLASFSIYAFVSNAALIRPLGESARLHLTQDLADLEMALEQLVNRDGGSSSSRGGGGGAGTTTTTTHLSQIDNGKPYAELRAVRQMLFWNGFESKTKSGSDLAKALLREVWIRDVRPSTVIHYLFSYAPTLLSSPHHVKRIKANDYIFQQLLIHLDDGLVDDGEEDAWMVTLSCCDSYAQRATTTSSSQRQQQHLDGDARVAQVLMNLGPELLRRRRH